MYRQLRLYSCIVLWTVIALASGADTLCGPSSSCPGAGAPVGVPCARFYIENPAVELFETVAHFDKDLTVTRILCQCRGGTHAKFTWDDDETAIESEKTCTPSTPIDETDIDNPDVAAGSDIDLDITEVTGGVTDCSFMMYCE